MLGGGALCVLCPVIPWVDPVVAAPAAAPCGCAPRESSHGRQIGIPRVAPRATVRGGWYLGARRNRAPGQPVCNDAKVRTEIVCCGGVLACSSRRIAAATTNPAEAALTPRRTAWKRIDERMALQYGNAA